MYFTTTFSLYYHPYFSSTNSSFDPYSLLLAHYSLYFLLSFVVYLNLQYFSWDEAIAAALGWILFFLLLVDILVQFWRQGLQFVTYRSFCGLYYIKRIEFSIIS